VNQPSPHDNVEEVVTLHLPGKFGYMRIARQSVVDFCMRGGFSEQKAGQLEMAVDEACSNIIEHSYGGEDQAGAQGIQIILMLRPGAVVVEIFDFGRGFDFEGAVPISPQQYLVDQRRRGLGLHIIRSFVDECFYSRNTASGNCLRLTKRV
jgi:serine/threonine-protein kinase RsbW